MEVKDVIEKSNLCIPKEQIKYDEPMKNYTSFKVGGKADVLIKVKNEEELKSILECAIKRNIPYYIIGNGSNLLVLDEGIEGIVIKNEITNIEIDKKEENEVYVKVGAGYKLGKLAYELANKDISGLEELAGIPGTIGGAVRMNAGAHGKEMKDIVKQITTIDKLGKKHILSNKEAKFEYRNSIFSKEDLIITEVILKLGKKKSSEIIEEIKKYAKIRKEKQPLEYPSAGSTFKRGDTYITAKLIDESGLKGYEIGGAKISEKHAGFVINTGNATSKDILDLIEYVKKEVFKKFGKEIKMEVEIIGGRK